MSKSVHEIKLPMTTPQIQSSLTLDDTCTSQIIEEFKDPNKREWLQDSKLCHSTELHEMFYNHASQCLADLKAIREKGQQQDPSWIWHMSDLLGKVAEAFSEIYHVDMSMSSDEDD